MLRNSSTIKDPEIFQSIIDQINANDEYSIVAYNNEITPFQLVFYVLYSVVPLTQQEAYNKTMEIHTHGKSIVYKGEREHCYKIGDALAKISVEFDIF
jgi:hypothetical protein